MVYLLNLSERDFLRKKNKWLAKIAAWIKERDPTDLILPFSCEFEQNVRVMIFRFSTVTGSMF